MSEARLAKKIKDGVAIVFSDCHYWPGEESTAHRGLIFLAEKTRPRLIIANGDVLDGSRISMHARIGWQNCPKLVEELDVCKLRLAQIANAGRDAEQVWCLGNHDARFETYLANNAAEFAGIPGFSLKEHFPEWQPCWSCTINGDVMVKHRWHGGPNATLQNTIKSGMSIVTGHLHALRVSPYSDYRGTRFGVDTGTLADPYGPQFTAYTEDASVDWRSGFVVLTFEDGRLLWPEPAFVTAPGVISFRGREWRV